MGSRCVFAQFLLKWPLSLGIVCVCVCVSFENAVEVESWKEESPLGIGVSSTKASALGQGVLCLGKRGHSSTFDSFRAGKGVSV